LEVEITEKIKPKTLSKIKQKLIAVHPIEISIVNETRHNIYYECEENVDGVKPKLYIKIKRLLKR